jgi:hypothetical protein
MASMGKSEEAWSIPDVFLLTEGGDGRVAISDLQLTFVATGVELAKADGELVWRCEWGNLDELSASERSVLPDGREGMVVQIVEHGGRRHRFVLPTSDPATLESSVRQQARAHRIHTSEPPRAVMRTLTVAVILAGLATLTVLLLSAAHVIHL